MKQRRYIGDTPSAKAWKQLLGFVVRIWSVFRVLGGVCNW